MSGSACIPVPWCAVLLYHVLTGGKKEKQRDRTFKVMKEIVEYMDEKAATERNKEKERDLPRTEKGKEGFCKGVMRLCRVPSQIVCSQASGSRCSPSCVLLSKQISPSELKPEGYALIRTHTHMHTHFDPVRSEASA